MTSTTLHLAALAVSLGLAHIDGTGQPGAIPVIYAFGGQPATIDLVVEPSGVNLPEPLEIRADLFQKGGAILAAVHKNILIAAPSRYEGCFQTVNGPFYVPLIRWKWTVPEVKRETEFIARLRMKSGNGEWLPSGQISLTAYPRDFAKTDLGPLSKARGLCIVGESKHLRDFFTTRQVAFDETAGGVDALPSIDGKGKIFLAELTSDELAAWLASNPHWEGNLVVFCPGAPLLPGVYVTRQSAFCLTKVTLPLLGSISSDPRSQKTFLEILNVSNNP